MNKKQNHPEPNLNSDVVRGMLETFSKSDKIPLEFRKELIRALKIILKHLKAGMTMTPSQMNELLEKKGLRKLFGVAPQ